MPLPPLLTALDIYSQNTMDLQNHISGRASPMDIPQSRAALRPKDGDKLSARTPRKGTRIVEPAKSAVDGPILGGEFDCEASNESLPQGSSVVVDMNRLVTPNKATSPKKKRKGKNSTAETVNATTMPTIHPSFAKAIESLAAIKLHAFSKKRKDLIDQKIALLQEIKAYQIDNFQDSIDNIQRPFLFMLAAWKLRFCVELYRYKKMKIKFIQYQSEKQSHEARLIQDIATLRQSISEHEANMGNLRRKTMSSESREIKIVQELTSLRTSTAEQKKSLSRMEDRLLLKDETIEKLNQAIEAEKKAMEDKAIEFENIKKALENEIDITRKTGQDIVMRNLQLEAQLELERNTTQELRQLLDEANKRHDSEVRELRDVSAKTNIDVLQTLETTKETLEDKLLIFRYENDNLHERVRSQEVEIGQLQAMLAETDKERGYYRNQFEVQTIANIDISAALESSQRETQSLKDVIGELAMKVQRVESESIDCATQLAKITDKYNRSKLVKTQLKDMVRGLEKSLESANKNIVVLQTYIQHSNESEESARMRVEDVETGWATTLQSLVNTAGYCRFLEEQIFSLRKTRNSPMHSPFAHTNYSRGGMSQGNPVQAVSRGGKRGNGFDPAWADYSFFTSEGHEIEGSIVSSIVDQQQLQQQQQTGEAFYPGEVIPGDQLENDDVDDEDVEGEDDAQNDDHEAVESEPIGEENQGQRESVSQEFRPKILVSGVQPPSSAARSPSSANRTKSSSKSRKHSENNQLTEKMARLVENLEEKLKYVDTVADNMRQFMTRQSERTFVGNEVNDLSIINHDTTLDHSIIGVVNESSLVLTSSPGAKAAAINNTSTTLYTSEQLLITYGNLDRKMARVKGEMHLLNSDITRQILNISGLQDKRSALVNSVNQWFAKLVELNNLFPSKHEYQIFVSMVQGSLEVCESNLITGISKIVSMIASMKSKVSVLHKYELLFQRAKDILDGDQDVMANSNLIQKVILDNERTEIEMSDNDTNNNSNITSMAIDDHLDLYNIEGNQSLAALNIDLATFNLGQIRLENLVPVPEYDVLVGGYSLEKVGVQNLVNASMLEASESLENGSATILDNNIQQGSSMNPTINTNDNIMNEGLIMDIYNMSDIVMFESSEQSVTIDNYNVILKNLSIIENKVTEFLKLIDYKRREMNINSSEFSVLHAKIDDWTKEFAKICRRKPTSSDKNRSKLFLQYLQQYQLIVDKLHNYNNDVNKFIIKVRELLEIYSSQLNMLSEFRSRGNQGLITEETEKSKAAFINDVQSLNLETIESLDFFDIYDIGNDFDLNAFLRDINHGKSKQTPGSHSKRPEEHSPTRDSQGHGAEHTSKDEANLTQNNTDDEGISTSSTVEFVKQYAKENNVPVNNINYDKFSDIESVHESKLKSAMKQSPKAISDTALTSRYLKFSGANVDTSDDQAEHDHARTTHGVRQDDAEEDRASGNLSPVVASYRTNAEQHYANPSHDRQIASSSAGAPSKAFSTPNPFYDSESGLEDDNDVFALRMKSQLNGMYEKYAKMQKDLIELENKRLAAKKALMQWSTGFKAANGREPTVEEQRTLANELLENKITSKQLLQLKMKEMELMKARIVEKKAEVKLLKKTAKNAQIPSQMMEDIGDVDMVNKLTNEDIDNLLQSRGFANPQGTIDSPFEFTQDEAEVTDIASPSKEAAPASSPPLQEKLESFENEEKPVAAVTAAANVEITVTQGDLLGAWPDQNETLPNEVIALGREISTTKSLVKELKTQYDKLKEEYTALEQSKNAAKERYNKWIEDFKSQYGRNPTSKEKKTDGKAFVDEAKLAQEKLMETYTRLLDIKEKFDSGQVRLSSMRSQRSELQTKALLAKESEL